ncbi:unnamed protein product [Fraxinus pennsylvanica]|uniref:Phosphoglycerate mutase family protein n=1 Tax=Fraxinus pennsylvanica TaxID=56036 RepID=A0AAD2E8U2_9LAMI|nr:unnamed protein product [Fraxinus pennsylvanica]
MVSSHGDLINESQFYQNVVVMRHGDRIDNFEPLWASTAARPWDPPLVEAGKIRAYCEGQRLRNELGFPIHRVFISPFLRCLQTAAEVVIALCAVDDHHNDPNDLSSNGVVIDPSKIKVSIEYGLSEMMNLRAIRPDVAPKDGVFKFSLSQCEGVLPVGTIDHAAEQLHKQLPKWQESLEGARTRYREVIKALADKYPSENLLLVTHGEGVEAAVCGFMQKVEMVRQVEYCAYSHSRRPIVFGENQSFTAGDLVGLHEGQVGITYSARDSKVALNDSPKKTNII